MYNNYVISDPEMMFIQKYIPWIGFSVTLVFLLILLSYILQSIGLYSIAKKFGFKRLWFAFVPVFSTYLQGSLAKEVTLDKITLKNPGLCFLCIPWMCCLFWLLLYFIVDSYTDPEAILWVWTGLSVFITCSILTFALKFACRGLILYSLYKKFARDTVAVVHMILSLSVPFYKQLYIFNLRNRSTVSRGG